MVTELMYSTTNTFLIRGANGLLLFDTGWAGTFRKFCREMGEKGIPVQEISYVLISHFHPDHCGIAQEIADCGATIAVMEPQRNDIHAADRVFLKEGRKDYRPVVDQKVREVALEKSREFLMEMGIEGEVIAMPGHSEDSISLCLDDGSIFVGDLNPLYELEMHRGTEIEESWKKLLARHPKTIYYGHAKTAYRKEAPRAEITELSEDLEASRDSMLVKHIMKYTEKGWTAERIQKKTGEPIEWIRDVMRMYLTHPGISVQGVLDRMEIRGR